MSSTDLVRSPIAIPPALQRAGVTVVEDHGVRAVVIPDTVKASHNVVQPVDEIAQADPDWSPRLVVVDLSADQYHYNEQGKRALSKNGVLLLAHAAGVEVDVEMIPRAQLRDTEIGYKATASIRRSDGTRARWTASKVADLVDEEEATKGTNEKWPVVKKHLAAKTESKAVLRAVAMALQLKRGGYVTAEMQKPFLIVGVSSTPSDPEVRRERVLAAAGDAYGKRALPPMDETSQYDDPTPAPAQLAPAPPADVVDAVPASARAQEPEPDVEPVAGEIPPDVFAAGQVVFPEGFKAVGKKVCEVRRVYLEHIAFSFEFQPQHEPLVQACRLWVAFLAKQPEPAA